MDNKWPKPKNSYPTVDEFQASKGVTFGPKLRQLYIALVGKNMTPETFWIAAQRNNEMLTKIIKGEEV